MSKNHASRRDFLKGSAAAAAGAAVTNLVLNRSVHAFAEGPMKVAVIGCGGRGTGAAENLLTVADDVKVVAVADAFENRAKGCAANLKKKFAAKTDIPDDRVFVGLDAFQKAIDCGVDMVIIAGPPGFRPQQYEAAIKAGKHVFMEKPCCTDAPGFRKLMEANKLADEKGLKVGVGLQRHHQAGYIDGVKAIQDGSIGDFVLSRVYWNGSGIWFRDRTPEMTEMFYQIHNWYHFNWLSGDNICEQHVHNIDVSNWVKGDHPVEANGMGACLLRYNKRDPKKGMGQIYDMHFVEFTYKDGTKMFSQCRHIPQCWNSVSEAIHGTKGVANPAAGKGTKLQFGNPYEQEHCDLMNAIRKNEKYNEGWYGATSSFTAVMGRMATSSGLVIKWDDAVAKGPDDFPATLAWDAMPKCVPDANGAYPIAIPGVYKPF